MSNDDKPDGNELKHSTLSEPFQKARRQFVLFSGLLFAWAFIGVKPPKDGMLPYDWDLEGPEAVPWVLLAVTAYFGVRTWIEWFQCSPNSRCRSASRLDVAMSTMIAVVSVGMYFISLLTISNLAQSFTPWSFAASVLALPGYLIGGFAYPLMGPARGTTVWLIRKNWDGRIMAATAIGFPSIGAVIVLVFGNVVVQGIYGGVFFLSLVAGWFVMRGPK